MDLNHRPLGYEPNELTRLLYPAIKLSTNQWSVLYIHSLPKVKSNVKNNLAGGVGIEPDQARVWNPADTLYLPPLNFYLSAFFLRLNSSPLDNKPHLILLLSTVLPDFSFIFLTSGSSSIALYLAALSASLWSVNLPIF